MYEAEIKWVVDDRSGVREALNSYASPREETYRDEYFVHPAVVPPGSPREFRVREIRRPGAASRSLLTFKDRVVDAESGSKREHEVAVAEPGALSAMLRAMGFDLDISLTKNCENWEFTHEGREVLATLVSVPELSGHFLEIETLASVESDVAGCLAGLRRLASDLGLRRADETTAAYTESVREARTS